MKADDLMLPVYVDERTNLKLPHEKFIEVLITLWSIWWARKDLIKEEFLSPHMIIREINACKSTFQEVAFTHG
jgi:hypothetical protein